MKTSEQMLINSLCIVAAPEILKVTTLFSGLGDALDSAFSGFASAIKQEKIDINLRSHFAEEFDNLADDIIQQLHNSVDIVLSGYGHMLDELENEGKIEEALEHIAFITAKVPDIAPLNQAITPKDVFAYVSLTQGEGPISDRARVFQEIFSGIADKMTQDQREEEAHKQQKLEIFKEALKKDNHETLQQMLSEGFSVETECDQGDPAICFAIKFSAAKCVKILIENGANVDTTTIKYIVHTKNPVVMGIIRDSKPPILNDIDWLDFIKYDLRIKELSEENENFFAMLIPETIENDSRWEEFANDAIHHKHNIVLEALLKNGLDANGKRGSNTLVFLALENKNFRGLELLLKHGADPNTLDFFDRSLLVKSINDGHFELATLLLNHNAKIIDRSHSDTHETLKAYSKGTHTSLPDALKLNIVDINNFDNTGRNFLHCAIERGDLELARCLLQEMKMDPNIPTSFRNEAPLSLVPEGEPELLQLLIDAGANINLEVDGKTILETIDPSYIAPLCRAGANPNVGYDTPLLHHFVGMKAKGIEDIIAAGVDVNVKDRQGKTVIQAYLTYTDNLEPNIEALIEAGVDLSGVSHSGLPLIHAISALYSPKALQLAHCSGADLDVTDTNGNTALIQACLANRPENVEVLANFNVDINAKNKLDASALMFAISDNNKPMVEVLLKHRADTNATLGGMNIKQMAEHLGHTDLISCFDEAPSLMNSVLRICANLGKLSVLFVKKKIFK